MRRPVISALFQALFLMTFLSPNAFPDEKDLAAMTRRFAPAKLSADTSKLTPGDRKALEKLLEAASLMDTIYLKQLWQGNTALYEKLKKEKDKSPLAKARFDYFWLNKGPWSDLDEHQAFLPEVPPRKPLGANFYPEDMTRQEFEGWAKKDVGFFSVIRRDSQTRALKSVPYSEEYRAELLKAAHLLKEAAAATTNASLKTFCELRAKAFLDDDYSASDAAWLDLDSPVDVTIGPYETYTDELFGYKAAYEAYVSIRDEDASSKLKFFADHLQEIENNLPMDAKFKNPKLGSTVPISVVNLLRASGDGAHGVMTAAYNLPNDEKIVKAKGTKQVMMKNVQQAKFNSVLVPIAGKLLPATSSQDISFDWFFTHILAHELSHGIGPHDNVRTSLKELYSSIEEAKADICGLFLLQYMFDKGMLPKAEKPLYTTFLASAFRSLRFGIQEAHGKGMAIQFNYLRDRGAFTVDAATGLFAVDYTKIAPAVRDLAHEILTIEANGDYAAAKRMIDTYAVVRPEMEAALDKLSDIPVDIMPEYATSAKGR
ncbi:MAG: hypothetical protein JST65_17585 [Acidobacteria bacterium]|nr:hypothetical protein [Acidobacteriota bacterium]